MRTDSIYELLHLDHPVSLRIAVTLICLHPFAANATTCQAHLRLLETTDLHVHIFPYDYYNDHPTENFGLARTATLIANARDEAANSVLVDNGDFLQGSPIGDYVAYHKGLSPGDLHPIIGAMNLLGYDAATLGNHEFNYGLTFLENTLARAAFPVVCANAVRKLASSALRDRTYLPPYVILDRRVKDGKGESHPIKIGIIGFLPPQTLNWDSDHLHGNLLTRDIVATARAYVPQMKEQGADLIIALAHSGIGAANSIDGMENASVPLALTAGIDVVASGHSHLVFPSSDFANLACVDVDKGTIAGKPAVMAGFWGSHLGVIDLLLERDGSRWKVLASQSEARPVARRDSNGILRSAYSNSTVVHDASDAAHKATLQFMHRSVGETAQDLHSFFALVADAPSLQLVCRAQAWHVEKKLIGTAHEGLPLLSAAAPFKAGGRAGPEHYTDVPRGRMELRNVADLYAFPNTIRAVRITGQQVADWLEKSAAAFNRIIPDQHDQPLMNADFPSYQFDVIMGVTYEIDPSQPPRYSAAGEVTDPDARRVRNLCHQGEPIDPAAEFIVATNSYRVGTTAAFSNPDSKAVVYQAPVTNRDILLRYIKAHRPLPLMTTPNWRLTPVPGASLIFDSSPAASRHLAGLADMRIEPLGAGPDGFARFRIAG